MKVTTDACLFGAWVALQLKQHLSARTILDIGGGTGLLSLMLAQQTDAVIDIIEIDESAYEQAKENIAASPWRDRIRLFHSDAKQFEPLSTYDIIISNPPFYENELKSVNTKKNIAHHGDALSLEELLHLIKKNLSPAGIFFLLYPYKRQEQLALQMKTLELNIIHKTIVKQSTLHDPFRIMIAGKLQSNLTSDIITEQIAITNEEGGYTPAFAGLLKDYYLNL